MSGEIRVPLVELGRGEWGRHPLRLALDEPERGGVGGGASDEKSMGFEAMECLVQERQLLVLGVLVGEARIDVRDA